MAAEKAVPTSPAPTPKEWWADFHMRSLQDKPNERLQYFKDLTQSLESGESGSPRLGIGAKTTEGWWNALLLGVQDIWSPIRKHASKELAKRIVHDGTVDEDATAAALERFFSSNQLLEDQAKAKIPSGAQHWGATEGFLLFIEGLLGGVAACKLRKLLPARCLHMLLTRRLCPLAFDVQRGIRELALQCLSTLLLDDATAPSAVFFDADDVAGYRGFLRNEAKDQLENNIDRPAADSKAVGASEGAISLFKALGVSLPRTILPKCAAHEAASVRHETAALLSAEEEDDWIAGLYTLCSRLEDDASWETKETHLMSLLLFLIELLRRSSYLTLPRITGAELANTAKRIVEASGHPRFDVQRMGKQLIPLWGQYMALATAATRFEALLLTMEDLDCKPLNESILLFISLQYRLEDQAPQHAKWKRTMEELFPNAVNDEQGSISSIMASSPVVRVLRGTYLLPTGVSPKIFIRDAIRRAWEFDNADVSAADFEAIAKTVMDFAALHPRIAMILELPTLWSAHVMKSTSAHLQCLLIEGLLILVKGKKNHRLFSFVDVDDLLAPTFEDDPNGVASGHWYIRKHSSAFPTFDVPAEDFQVPSSLQADDDLDASTHAPNPALSTVTMREGRPAVEAICEMIKVLMKDRAAERSVLSRIQSLALAMLERSLISVQDSLLWCVTGRLDATCGNDWRAGSSPKDDATKKASEDNWDDDDDDDWDAEEPATSGAVDGVSFRTEVEFVLKMVNGVKVVAKRCQITVGDEEKTIMEDVNRVNNALK